jgi:hypothetical protein
VLERSRPTRYAAIALATTIVPAVLLLPIPDAIPSTYASAVALMFGAASVTLMAWRNALPTDTIGQLLHRTESGDAPRIRTVSAHSGRSR